MASLTVVLSSVILVTSLAPLTRSYPTQLKQTTTPGAFIGEGINYIATALLQDSKIEGNAAFSPLGHAAILTALTEGAAGPTRSQMLAALKLPQDHSLTRATYRSVLTRLKGKGTVNRPEFRSWFYIYKKTAQVEDAFTVLLRDSYLMEVRDIESEELDTPTEFFTKKEQEIQNDVKKPLTDVQLESNEAMASSPETDPGNGENNTVIGSGQSQDKITSPIATEGLNNQQETSTEKSVEQASKPMETLLAETTDEKEASNALLGDVSNSDAEKGELPSSVPASSNNEGQITTTANENETPIANAEKEKISTAQEEPSIIKEESSAVDDQNKSEQTAEQSSVGKDEQQLGEVPAIDGEASKSKPEAAPEPEKQTEIENIVKNVGDKNTAPEVTDQKVPVKQEEKKDDFTKVEKLKSGREETAGTNDDRQPASGPSLITSFNALYYKGSWETPFESKFQDDFYTDKGEAKRVTILRTQGEFRYGEIKDLNATAIELPYKDDNGRYSLLVLLPSTKEGLSNVTLALSKFSFRNLAKHMREKQVDIALPEFEIDCISHPENAFRALGMTSMLDKEKAEFPGISKSRRLYLQDDAMAQLVRFRLDDNTATANYLSTASMSTRSGINVFLANHPFIFYLRDNIDKLTIVAGRVVDPSRRPEFSLLQD